jgi:hypothetical protein
MPARTPEEMTRAEEMMLEMETTLEAEMMLE